jgi:hypothetical protein
MVLVHSTSGQFGPRDFGGPGGGGDGQGAERGLSTYAVLGFDPLRMTPLRVVRR